MALVVVGGGRKKVERREFFCMFLNIVKCVFFKILKFFEIIVVKVVKNLVGEKLDKKLIC